MEGAIRCVKERAARTPNSFMAAQFENQDNPNFHYETTAREFYDQLQGQVDAVVIGAGTGGTFTGVARYFKNAIRAFSRSWLKPMALFSEAVPRAIMPSKASARASFPRRLTLRWPTKSSPSVIATDSTW